MKSFPGAAAEEIAAYAKKHKPQLIVMGTHGWGEIMTLIMGSVAEGVMRRTEIPVMLLRGRHEDIKKA